MSLIEAPVRRASAHGVAFWSIAAVFLIAMAFSTVPTPLYPIYQAQDGFSAVTVTVVFAVYAVGVVTSLLLAGHISDWAGRRRVLLPALALEAVAAVLFLVWPSLPGLLVARFVTGLGVGMLTATATAYLLELHGAHRPSAGRGRFELVSAAANLGGLGAGTLVAGALAQFVTAPLRTPYAVFLVLLLASMVAVALAPETVTHDGPRPRYRPQRIRVAAPDLRAYVAAGLAAFTAFAVFGLFTSLAPSFVAGTLHHTSRLLAGVVVFAAFGTAAAAQAGSNGLTPLRRLVTGLVAETLGVTILAAGMLLPSLALFLVGGAVAGAGAGLLFKTAVSTVAASAAPEVRGEALAGLFLIGYLGLIGPALGLGLATRFVPATEAMLWFSAMLLVLLTATAATGLRRSRG